VSVQLACRLNPRYPLPTNHAQILVSGATRQDIARASVQTTGSRYGPKYPFASIITCVVSVTNTSTEPPVPAGTIAAFATKKPLGAFIVYTSG
jgi:hypothetical protein